METHSILNDVLVELKEIKQTLQDNTLRIVKTEISIETINKGIESIDQYRERVNKLEYSYQRLSEILERTNQALEKMDKAVDAIQNIMTAQKSQDLGRDKTYGTIWEIFKWLGAAAVLETARQLFNYFHK